MGIIDQLASHLDSLARITPMNRYSFSIDGLDMTTEISVLSLEGKEQLNQPWQYCIDFTSTNRQISIDSVLSQTASLTFHPNPLPLTLTQISSLDIEDKPRTLYGVITEFSFVSMSEDQAHYRVVFESKVALLANHHQSAIFQNRSVVEVVEEVLRNHGFIGIDFRMELNETYPAREFITQWQESDLSFIQRLLADVGIWFYFETHPKHRCDVMVMSDYEQGLKKAGNIAIKQPSGLNDSRRHSVWDLQFSSKTKPNQVRINDYNYRTANNNLHITDNSQQKDITTRGDDYRYEEHHKTEGDIQTVESGKWYAHIRHQQHITEQLTIYGKCNDYQLVPGQLLIIDSCPINDIKDGIIIVATHSHGDRTESYQTHFTAIPFNVLKPYRPAPLPWPQVSGTLPARVTSPNHDTYGYIDPQGRYRIKFNFDLKNWKKGEESLWVRLAKPYSGNTYGFHFPLIEGTEVAVAFTNGNPDRPYIAHAMHDSAHPDHVSLINKHRNVIRTPANNKLRMDDKRGQEHIKLATEYGKTQLNLGHLVDNKKIKRGEGFELRTDEWGAIRAGKGVYVTTTEQEKAAGQQLEMQDSIKQIEKSLNISYALIECGKSSGAEPAEISQQQALQSATNQLQQPTVVIHGDQGIAQTSSKSIQSAASENIIVTAGKNASVNIFKKLSMAAGEMVSIFAHKLGIKLIAASGRVEIQAQSDELELTAQKNMFITSSGGKVTINAQQELLLLSGGAGIRIKNGTIELIAPTSILQKTALLSYSGAESIKEVTPSFNKGDFSRKFKLHFNGSSSQVLKNHPYRIHFSDGSTQDGMTDENGETQMLPMTELEQLKIEILTKD
ncbi:MULTISPECIES: type VI secretion system Vgr family protein [unclassified Gilliamella]|uniref:type VI secretion system Vgr family protein n=1 Tax=unclassified Gilliamella TaxID=2685620 RepID=UPI0009C15875|nr:type VI secretion system Vgr family protein [Gilliamella apicola]